jgi:hypothetical protein
MHSSRTGVTVVFLAFTAACGSEDEQPGDPAAPPPIEDPTDVPPVNDPLPASRLLRRASLALRGASPEMSEYEALQQLPTEEARIAAVNQAIEKMLGSKELYREVVQWGKEWFALGDYLSGGKSEGYLWRGDNRAYIFECPAGTKHAGAFYGSRAENGYNYPPSGPNPPICDDLDKDRRALARPVINMIEPWWAPGKSIKVLGQIGTGVKTDPVWGDCRRTYGGIYGVQFSDAVTPNTCSCGPNLAWCTPSDRNYYYNAESRQPGAMARQGWEEPARLLGHVAFNDRPLTDLVLGNYSVGPAALQALYVGQGRNLTKNAFLDDDDSWWRPSAWSGPADPDHEPSDPLAWREFVVEKRNPMLLSLSSGAVSGALDRTYAFDPRSNAGDPNGIPAAGVLTMPISNSTFARERVRAARWLEKFACRSFVPPSPEAKFNDYTNDPARGGTCRHCHELMDPAAIHFKRLSPDGPGYNSFLGIGQWRMEKFQPYDAPRGRLDLALIPGTVLTPVTAEQASQNPNAKLIDFLPPDQTLFGQVSDGTIGPLGFAKMLVKSGEFDRCMTQRLYQKLVGRALDPGVEKNYIDKLTEDFVKNGRSYRGFARIVVQTSEFRRGL